MNDQAPCSEPRHKTEPIDVQRNREAANAALSYLTELIIEAIACGRAKEIRMRIPMKGDLLGEAQGGVMKVAPP